MLGYRSLGLCLTLALLVVFQAAPLTGQVPSNVFRRVLMIKAGASIGTAFTIDVDGRQYLITAKHVVADLKDEDNVDIRKGAAWQPTVFKVLRCPEPIDIAVLIPRAQLTVSFALDPDNKFFFGQDVYFVGFPYGLATDGKNVNGAFPLAFMKKGIISATQNEGDATLLFVDGHNNPGFSGGPIVYRNLNQSQPNVFHVAAVVSGFRHEYEPVLRLVEVKPGDKKLVETGELVRQNTGIVRGYAIRHALELIRKNPTGPKVSDTFEP